VTRDVAAPDITKCMVWPVVKIELLRFSTRRHAFIMRRNLLETTNWRNG
jgi:hypothetical protein